MSMTMQQRVLVPLAAIMAICAGLTPAAFADHTLHTFARQRLTDVYFSEGISVGDLNRDGQADVVYGPYWFEGPAFTTKHEIYKPVPQNREGYADHFFAWVYDFNGDGWNDVFVVGFPGTPAHVYENPGKQQSGKHWNKHQVFDWVSNESPHFTNLVGDERPELVCTRDGFFGFATVNWDKPFAAWTFHPISAQVTAKRFGHGLGVGDVNGDGRLDVIHAKGWFEQPPRDANKFRWVSHAVSFSNSYGGAEMYAYDVDGDGDNDIITSHAAHDFGLGWYEQVRTDKGITFKHHLIMGFHPSQNHYGVVFSEPHSVQLADIDGDGLKDIITGKTYYSHHKNSPMWDAGAVVYWFKLVRGKEGVDWLPYKADGEAGIGRQICIADVNDDGLPDIVTGGMKGAHVLKHVRKTVDRATWEKAQPQPYKGERLPSSKGAKALRGPRAPLASTGKVPEALEGESLEPRTSGGRVGTQKMAGFNKDHWSSNAQLFWSGARPGDKLTVKLPARTGSCDLEVVCTCARDYAIVQLLLDNKPLGTPIDLYNPEVITTGVLRFPGLQLEPGSHTLTVQIVGANPKAVKSYLFGLDYLRLKAKEE
jgi:hypothetical protein